MLWLCGIAIGYSLMISSGSVKLGPGVKAPDQPVQSPISAQTPVYLKGCELRPLADYSIKAKILCRKNYRGRGSKICPIDFALGWGNMSNETVLEKIDISQSGRFFYWSAKELPIPQSEIISSSANVHIIPASELVESILRSFKQGQIVYLEGKLVKVKSPDGWNAASSLIRSDSGPGACEVMLVEIAFHSDQ